MPDSTEGFAQSQLRSYVTRILNVLGEIDALGDDKKSIYKELADEGFDRSVVSQLVGHLRKKAKKPGKFAEQSALFDLYLAAYEGRVDGGDEDEDETGTVRANAHAAREQADADGVVEHISPPAQTVPSVEAERQPDNTEIAPSAGGLAEEASNSSAPIQPETAAQTDHALVVAPPPSSTEHEAVESSELPLSTEPALEQVLSGSPAELIDRSGHEQGVRGAGGAPDSLGSAADKSGEPGGVSPSTSPAPTKLKMNAEFFGEPDPRCQRPGFCGGNSAIALCDACKAAAGIAHDGPTFQPEASVH